jgi:hypothetical protein
MEKTAKKESDLEREKNKDSDKVEDKEKEKEEKEKLKEIEKEIEKEKNNEMILNEQIIFYLFNDYVESYRSLLLKLYSEKKDIETIQDIKDLFWEMPNLAFEELSFSHLDISTVNTKEVKLREGNIKNLFLLSVLISTFKAVLIESSIEKVTVKESFIKALSQNTQNSRLSKLSEYFELMKSTYPLFYLESVILLTVSGFLTNQSPSEKDFKIWLVELLRAWEFSSTYSKFLRRSNDLKSLSSNYSESIRSLVILILIACYKNLYSNSVKQVLEFVDLDSRFYETSNLESVLLGLRVPTVSEFNDTPVKIIIEKVRGVIRSNQEVNSNSSSQQVEIEKEILSIIN